MDEIIGKIQSQIQINQLYALHILRSIQGKSRLRVSLVLLDPLDDRSAYLVTF